MEYIFLGIPTIITNTINKTINIFFGLTDITENNSALIVITAVNGKRIAKILGL